MRAARTPFQKTHCDILQKSWCTYGNILGAVAVGCRPADFITLRHQSRDCFRKPGSDAALLHILHKLEPQNPFSLQGPLAMAIDLQEGLGLRLRFGSAPAGVLVVFVRVDLVPLLLRSHL